MGLVLTTAPTGEPLTLAEAKLHCRVDGTDDDTLITALIVTARKLAEGITGRALLTQKWKLLLDAFPLAAIDIPLLPLVSVESVKYLDGDGVQQTLDPVNYKVHTSTPVGLVAPAYGFTWPAARVQREAIEIAFTVGYGNAAAVPAEIKQWMLLCIGGWYANRESIAFAQAKPEQLPRGMWDVLLDGYCVTRFS